MDKNEAWVAAAAAAGSTDSERILTRLARKAFLSMWSYANVYTDEGRKGGKGAGKEFCDLLVVFGDHILLFSDKHCVFKDGIDIKVAWGRWYRSAVEKSCRQLEGAEKFLKEHPGRLFLDSLCQIPFPVPLPPADRAVFHLIAVTRGGHAAGAKHFGRGSSGTPVLFTGLVGDMHLKVPFHIGYPLTSKRFVHVLDEVAVDVLLEELDTVADLVAYLAAKEDYIGRCDMVKLSGEEDLLARYMLNEDSGRRRLDLVNASEGELVVLEEGDWHNYRNSPEQVGRLFLNKESYMWDQLIEYHSSLVQHGTALTGDQIFGDGQSGDQHELILRAMASETRLSRRRLAEQLRQLLNRPLLDGQVHTKLVSIESSRAYLFLTLRKGEGQTYDDYRRFRAGIARVYAFGYFARMTQLKDMVCIVSEPIEEVGSRDLLYVQFTEPMTPDEVERVEQQARQLGILRPDTKVMIDRTKVSDFPMKFEIERPPVAVYSSIKDAMAGSSRGYSRTASNAKRHKKKQARR